MPEEDEMEDEDESENVSFNTVDANIIQAQKRLYEKKAVHVLKGNNIQIIERLFKPMTTE